MVVDDRPSQAQDPNRVREHAADPFGTLIRVAAYTGMRAGELKALRVGRFELLKSRLLVAESVTEVHGHGMVFGPTKTYERRTIPLMPSICDELGALLATRPNGPDTLVFTSPDGGALRHRNFYDRHFKPAVRAANLPANMRFHSLRQTCAAMCIALGAHPKAIQERLGQLLDNGHP
ncbi:MAG TPA: site-specific integrase [Acidimicrobiales bacterium]|nr:site-specific integrase [Acidimicrobiales bacterium]